MTEKDLFRFKYAVFEERRRRLVLIEHETRMNAVRLSSTPTAPGGGGSDTSGKVAADLDRIDRCRAKLKEAIDDVSLAELVLESARKHLDDKERVVFDSLYFGYVNHVGERVFYTIGEAAKKLNYAQSTIYGIRHKILEKVAPLPV